MKIKIALLLVLTSLFLNSFSQSISKWSLVSPNKKNSIIISLQKGALVYSVLLEGKQAIQPSSLGIETTVESFNSGLQVSASKTNQINESYTLAVGKRKLNTAKANELVLIITNQNNRKIQLLSRAYDDGVAFAYNFPEVKQPITISKEYTTFSIPTKGTAWLQPYGLPAQWAPAYEAGYSLGSSIGENAPDTGGWCFPALFYSQNNWVLITEAGLDKNFYGSHLAQQSANGVYKISSPQTGEANGLYTTTAIANQSFHTPWRVIMLGKNLSTIIESNLVHHLAAPNVIGDFSWVKPGRASWSWWSDHPSSRDFTKLKNYVDLAKDMGWEYSLIDANWNIMQGGKVEDLINYAKTKNIGLSLWYNSGGPHTDVTEQPRDIMFDPVKRKAEFKKLHEWGVKAVKVDFFNSDKQQLIQLYQDILKDAADQKIMVVFHGCTIPRGWARTYPNLVSMEAVKGAEQYGWDPKYAANAPAHNIILAFTRNVVGSMDFTPVTFSSYPCCKHATTNAYELSLSVLFESGIQHFADSDSSYRSQSQAVKNFLRMVPNTWDDIKFLDGYPGKLAVIARRKGTEWYVAAVNGEATQKTISPTLLFLPKGTYHITILKDGASANDIQEQNMTYKTGDKLSVNVLPNGGYVMRIRK